MREGWVIKNVMMEFRNESTKQFSSLTVREGLYQMKKVHTSMYLVSIMILLVYSNIFAGKKDTLILDEWATVKTLVGKAEVRSSESGKWREAQVGMRIKMEWDVRTHLESSLELLFPSKTLIKMGENSTISLSTLFNDKDSTNAKSKIEVTSENDSINVITITDKKSKEE